MRKNRQKFHGIIKLLPGMGYGMGKRYLSASDCCVGG